MNEEQMINELLQTQGKCILLGTDGHFALEVSSELINDRNLFKFLSFTTDLKNGLCLVDYDEAINDCNVFCYEDYQDLTSKITMYETLELFKGSHCVSYEVYAANGIIFKEVDWNKDSKAQLIVFEVLDESGDVVYKDLKLLVDFDYTNVDVTEWNLLGEFDSDETFVSGVFSYLSEACYDFSTDWNQRLWNRHYSASCHIVGLMKQLK
ncbi:hypothetical protein HYN36_17220 [Vibrio parahaemolyticus]|nr:hypothetical protein [Vibrio parahaemolyticus]MBM5311807.1 hypothetical protein [Vibrio parahaemolyticus]MBM5336160.1 hypothetical protein [Vibrio parahaemolyticus]MCF9894229.1 hypothetical protein [Vibrio parahaemolyticus]MCF9914650.1 hypothetical protein [Vibrio parahaemolyticus]